MAEKKAEREFVYSLFSKEEKLKKGIPNDQVIDLVDSLLFIGVDYNASDLHLEQNQENLRVRYRIDGVLYDQDSIDSDIGMSIISRLKILSGLDIAEKRMPQDGKILANVFRGPSDHNLVDMRISTFPTIYGEKMVIRILDASKNKISLDNLGMNSKMVSCLQDLVGRPHGFFLITGPTGSGKTTTLYSILSYLNNGQKNIVTMEDPVEYNIDGVVQSQINEKSGFTFPKGLRSILRQDPDIIMVGEIRDKETAKIAIEAALTGHLVFSTLHTNDTVSSITRLVNMGVDPYLINAALSGVLSQRLVRKLCNNCKSQDAITDQEMEYIKNKNINLENINLSEINRPCGCNHCFNLGYKGRLGVFELLKVDDELRDLISKKSDFAQIKKKLLQRNMKFIEADALEKVYSGDTSLEEFLKVLVV